MLAFRGYNVMPAQCLCAGTPEPQIFTFVFAFQTYQKSLRARHVEVV